MTRRAAGTLALAAAAIVLLALTLRIAVASLSPLLVVIGRDFPLPAAVVGLIGMAPPVAFALSGMVAPAIERRLGLERSVLIAAIVAASMLGLRAAAVDAWTLLAATAGVFAAVGVANVLIPAVVKKYFPERIGLMTTVYTTTMAVATFTPPLVAVPLAAAVGWRGSFVLWAVVALSAVVPWIAMSLRARASRADLVEEPRTSVLSRIVRVPQTWALVVTFAVNSSIAYGLFAWLPPLLIDVAGVDAAAAGGLLALFSFMGLPVSLVVPLLVQRIGRTTPFYAVAVFSGLLGAGGLLFAPTAATVLWVVLIGIPPLLFPMVLVLFGLRTRSHETAVALSGLVQSVGYGLAALMPLAIGVTHEITGGWTAALVLLGCAVACAVPAGIVVARRETIEDAWERRTGRTW
ncbi:MFS transporter, CP family, cyanate transporter [Microbacterium sp. ru370.1]|uniref:MFS transporter n=1 Tax=unclassified Microbacterium TaxID=2609290 RepID=UPI0008832CFF|nr:MULTISPECIES: MFS transporter [unclassified Microbacterium]SDO39306.1 MFS transporter, CP family, cyanate transporter [Microbacterium sp. ru370.1]SIT79303.1 MFS transporter, CP family, cyanate transporter [Microbacterium sp. RU1D]